MPFVRNKEDAEFVRKAMPFKCCAPQEFEGEFEIIPSHKYGIAEWSQNAAYLSAFIAGLYAERDRAAATQDTSPARSADG